MPTSYTSHLGLALPVTGELSGTWGDTVNDYITTYLDGAVAGAQSISGNQTAVTLSKTTGTALTQVGVGSTGSSQYSIIHCVGSPASMLTITAPATSKVYVVLNETATNQQVKLVGPGPTTGVTLAAGENAVVSWSGTDFVKVASSAADGVSTFSAGTTGLTPSTATSGAVTLAGTLATTNGGTGLTSFTSDGAVYASSTSALTTGTLPVASGGTGLTSGSSGGLLYYSATNTLASSSTLSANALMVGGGAGVAPTTITTGTGVVTALGVNTGSSGAFVVNGGALGTPSSGTVTNLTGTASININGTVGATTPTTGAFTTVSASGVVTVSAGSVSAPAIIPTGDTNTGIFFPAADEIALVEGGTEALRITSANFTRPLAYADTVVALGNSGTATTINLQSGNVFTATLTGNCTFTLSNPIATGSSSFTLILTNDGTGGRTVAWSGGTFRFPGGASALGRTATANAVDVWVFFTPNGGTTWYGAIPMKNLSA
jgi:hypothetical protein